MEQTEWNVKLCMDGHLQFAQNTRDWGKDGWIICVSFVVIVLNLDGWMDLLMILSLWVNWQHLLFLFQNVILL